MYMPIVLLWNRILYNQQSIAKKTTNHREKHIFVRYPDTTECCHPRIVMKKKRNSAYLQLFWRKYLRMIIRIKDGKLYMASSCSFSGKLLRCVAIKMFFPESRFATAFEKYSIDIQNHLSTYHSRRHNYTNLVLICNRRLGPKWKNSNV